MIGRSSEPGKSKLSVSLGTVGLTDQHHQKGW